MARQLAEPHLHEDFEERLRFRITELPRTARPGIKETLRSAFTGPKMDQCPIVTLHTQGSPPDDR